MCATGVLLHGKYLAASFSRKHKKNKMKLEILKKNLELHSVKTESHLVIQAQNVRKYTYLVFQTMVF